MSGLQDAPRAAKRLHVGLSAAMLRIAPAKLLLIGYVSYMIVGWVLLTLPIAQAQPVSVLDALFISASAVSTTGLVTVDPGTSFTFFGEVVIAAMIQLGGLGYMTIGSFLTLAVQNRLSRVRREAARDAFNLPKRIKPRNFIISVVVFTLICQTVGAIALYPALAAAEVPNPAWSAIFHSISAFCTAGFSLISTGFEEFRGDLGVNFTLALLSILGAMGFLIVVDGWRTLTGQARHLGFTSKVIVRITLAFLLFGTVALMIVDPGIAALPAQDRLMTAFFQTMTASTTVGFNTWPIGDLSMAALLVLIFLMVIGASPAGTGGGLKTTSFAALVGLVRSTLKGRDAVRFFKREIPPDRLQNATAALAYYCIVLLAALFLLALTEATAPFEALLFEAVSALGTVGLSMGITGDLSPMGKIVVILLMTAGRVGILTFGMAVAAHDESRDEERDNELVC